MSTLPKLIALFFLGDGKLSRDNGLLEQIVVQRALTVSLSREFPSRLRDVLALAAGASKAVESVAVSPEAIEVLAVVIDRFL
jgi:hypothetical protein